MSIKKYINQLIQDIHAAHKLKNDSSSNSLPFVNEDDDFMESQFQDVENFLNFEPEFESTFGSIVGLELEQFPKTDLLTSKQIEKILNAFQELLSSYNISVDMPKKVKLKDKYNISLQLLNESLFLSENGMVVWDACMDDSTTCPYKKHCFCKKIDKEIKRNTKEAKLYLIDIITACADRISQFGHMKLEIANVHEDEFNKVCMFIGNGNDYVHIEILQNPIELEMACRTLQNLFKNDSEIISLFENVKSVDIHKNLETLFSLKVEKLSGNTLLVEPYYIQDGFIYKDEKGKYTPEELMDKLEAGEEE